MSAPLPENSSQCPDNQIYINIATIEKLIGFYAMDIMDIHQMTDPNGNPETYLDICKMERIQTAMKHYHKYLKSELKQLKKRAEGVIKAHSMI